MECRNFKITLVSAENLPDIRSHHQMKVYAEVSLNGDFRSSQKTTADLVGETNPRWNVPFDFNIVESSINDQGLQVVVKLYCERTRGDKCIGEVKIPVKSLFDMGIKSVNELSYDVPWPHSGRLNIMYSFGGKYLGTKPSADSWRRSSAKGVAQIGVMVLVQGVWFLLTGDPGLL